jgi:transcriptional regulator with XRE-family HTH domain
MSTEFSMDLRTARRKSGLTQRDCAHLLGAHKSRISILENGKHLPTLVEICTLSLIYGRTFESLFSGLMKDARQRLRRLIPSLPVMKRSYVENFNRDASIKRLKRRLDAEASQHDSP